MSPSPRERINFSNKGPFSTKLCPAEREIQPNVRGSYHFILKKATFRLRFPTSTFSADQQ
ncbi:hypothetical protein GCWU000246_00234 [Jonquetella anthropi E3_33 E1]|nr:hypothetical protein GCWU000246_00234 [Jonquetella anthropi E3_33 E1]